MCSKARQARTHIFKDSFLLARNLKLLLEGVILLIVVILCLIVVGTGAATSEMLFIECLIDYLPFTHMDM
jgi:hypothetical protein